MLGPPGPRSWATPRITAAPWWPPSALQRHLWREDVASEPCCREGGPSLPGVQLFCPGTHSPAAGCPLPLLRSRLCLVPQASLGLARAPGWWPVVQVVLGSWGPVPGGGHQTGWRLAALEHRGLHCRPCCDQWPVSHGLASGGCGETCKWPGLGSCQPRAWGRCVRWLLLWVRTAGKLWVPGWPSAPPACPHPQAVLTHFQGRAPAAHSSGARGGRDVETESRLFLAWKESYSPTLLTPREKQEGGRAALRAFGSCPGRGSGALGGAPVLGVGGPLLHFTAPGVGGGGETGCSPHQSQFRYTRSPRPTRGESVFQVGV